nr:ATP-binding cassette domain-containing protein [Actinomycetales bacterium]
MWLSYGADWVLRGASLQVEVGEVVGLWGPSGCGKSSLARVLTGRLAPQRGEVAAPPNDGRARSAQLVLQHSELAMNPRWKIEQVLAEASADVAPVIDSGLVNDSWLSAFPHELSGGELQRVNLARALLAQPRFVVADEITASLDALTQVQIWQLLLEGARAGRYGVLAISHDGPLLEHIADRVVAMDEINPPA